MSDTCPGCGMEYELAFPHDNEICLARQLAQRDKRIAELEAELVKWPRVYWRSMEPDSLEKGYRVLSVAGKMAPHGKKWMEVLVYDGEDVLAPVDFGIYATHEDAVAAQAGSGT